MQDIYGFAKYPTSEDWDNICEKKKESIKKIHLKEERKTFSMFDFKAIEMRYWLKEFNNRAFDLINSYVMMMYYYHRGIPDEEWYISPGKNDESVQYFPHFGKEHFCYLYWFGFYMDIYYSKFFSLIDTIYHLFNIKFELNIQNSVGFQKRIMNKLETEDKELFEFLKSGKENNDVYKRVSEFRNDLLHNYRPNQIDSGMSYKKENGKIRISMSVGNYTTTKEFVENIEESIDLMAFILDKVREKL